MAQTIVPHRTQEVVVSQLDTYNFTTNDAGDYTASVMITELPPSSISIVIQHNSSTVITSVAPSSTQGTITLQALIPCSIGDVISVILSSSAASDALPNAFKGFINIRNGTV